MRKSKGWRRFIVPKKLKKLIGTYNSNKIKIGMTEIRVSDSRLICFRWIICFEY